MRSDQSDPRSWIRRTRPGTSVLLVGLTLLGALVRPQDTFPGTEATTRAVPGSLRVDVEDQTVTVRAKNVSAKALLEEIARQGGLTMDLEAALDERRSLELDRLPLSEALHRILRGHSFILQYTEPGARGGGQTRGAHPGKLWVFSTAAGKEEAPPKGDDTPLSAEERLGRLTLAMADGDAKVRLGAVSELTELGGQPALAVLADAALSDENPPVRREAVYGLGEIGHDSALGTLEEALRDPDPRVQQAAVEAVADIGGEDSAWALSLALGDEDASLREQAVYALGEIGGETAIAILQLALADEQSVIREAASEILQELSSQEE